MNETQKAARSALFSLKEATLKVLCEVRESGDGYIQPDKIRERLGIPKAYEPNDSANSLTYGVLYHLQKDKSVEHRPGEGWKITAETAELLTGRTEKYDHEIETQIIK